MVPEIKPGNRADVDFNLGFCLAFEKSILWSPHSGPGTGSDLHTTVEREPFQANHDNLVAV